MRKVMWRAFAALAVGLVLAIPGTAMALNTQASSHGESTRTATTTHSTFVWLWTDQVPTGATAGGAPVTFTLTLYNGGPSTVLVSSVLLRLYTVGAEGTHLGTGASMGILGVTPTPSAAPTSKSTAKTPSGGPSATPSPDWVPVPGTADGTFTIGLGSGRALAARSSVSLHVQTWFSSAAPTGSWRLQPAMGTCSLVDPSTGKAQAGTMWPMAINDSLTVSAASLVKLPPPPTTSPTGSRGTGSDLVGPSASNPSASAPAPGSAGAPPTGASPSHRGGSSGGGGYTGGGTPPTVAPARPFVALPPVPVAARPVDGGGLVGPLLMASGTAAIVGSLFCLVLIWRGGRDRHLGGHRV